METFRKLPIFFTIVLGILTGCNSSSEKAENDTELHEKTAFEAPETKKLSPTQAYEMASGDQEMIIMDVRTPEEYESGHIEGAININLRSEDFQDKLKNLNKEKKYLVYCMGGHRSNRAQLLMDSLDFEQVFDLEGGFRQWSAADLPSQ